MVSSITTGNEIEEGNVTFVNDVSQYAFTNRKDKDVFMFFCFLSPATIEDGIDLSSIDKILYSRAKGIWMYFDMKKHVKYGNYTYSRYCAINGCNTGTQKYYASYIDTNGNRSVANNSGMKFNSRFLAGRTYHYVIIYDN